MLSTSCFPIGFGQSVAVVAKADAAARRILRRGELLDKVGHAASWIVVCANYAHTTSRSNSPSLRILLMCSPRHLARPSVSRAKHTKRLKTRAFRGTVPTKSIDRNRLAEIHVPLMSSRLFAIRQTTVVAEAFHLTFILEARKSNCVVLYHNQQLLHTAPSALEMIVRLLF